MLGRSKLSSGSPRSDFAPFADDLGVGSSEYPTQRCPTAGYCMTRILSHHKAGLTTVKEADNQVGLTEQICVVFERTGDLEIV